jgi:nitric oxide reductase NorD protein
MDTMPAMTRTEFSALESLQIADPETYVWVKGRAQLLSPKPAPDALAFLAQETIWGLSREAGLGRAVAEGLLSLMARAVPEQMAAFAALVHQASRTGLTLGRLMATFAAPALLGGTRLLEQFQQTLAIMLTKGTYTVSAPMEVMAELVAAGENDAASAYLDLLAATFEQQISYNQSLRLVYLIPKAVRSFAPARRKPQIEEFKRLACQALQLIDPFLEGMTKGLALLDHEALAQFNTLALEKYARRPESGMTFLSLASKAGQEACAALQRAVALDQVCSRLGRYVNARMGRSVPIKSLSQLPGTAKAPQWVCSDGCAIYLPEEIGCFDNQAANTGLYKALVRLEAGYFECGTFDFDLERAMDAYPLVSQWIGRHPVDAPSETRCEAERFLDGFTPRDLADDLFTIFEQARVCGRLKQRYPGLMRQVMPQIGDQARRTGLKDSGHLLAPVFARLILEQDDAMAADPRLAAAQARLIDLFYTGIDAGSPVEASCRLVCLAFDYLQTVLGRRLNRYEPFCFPYGRRIRWDLVSLAYALQERSVLRIKMQLQQKQLDVYRSDLRNRLMDRQGMLSTDDLFELVLARGGRDQAAGGAVDFSGLDLEALLRASGAVQFNTETAVDDAARYPEWDYQSQDYLRDHTFVRDIQVAAEGDGWFYHETLTRYRGLLTRMRRAFELLKPEGLAILRQWPEGDAFDYRALIDFAIDRRAGRMPSERLFIKRLKQERDVAVLLLADLSRSTANPVAGGHATVLDVAKEALVLFCEALQVVGDAYAIAGFSGTGRHAVDFYRIKTFQESLSDEVRARISKLRPQRSTRMGAAVRHAAALLAQVQARVRLMIVVSDGFPNDLGYKADYAIADTRRAVLEARARGFHVKAITVNIGSDPRLDDLYGRVHHHIIGDVRELPDKLLRLYGTLTRH